MPEQTSQSELKKNYSGVSKLICKYWKYYGGFHALKYSPYLHLAVGLTIVLCKLWLNANWWDTVLGILPNVLGFSLGGYAILLAFGDSEFQKMISGANENGKCSPYMTVNSAFVHFILVQIASILYALLCKAFYFELPSFMIAVLNFIHIPVNTYIDFTHYIFWPVGFLLFLYAILLAVASTLAIFRMSTWLDEFRGNENNSSVNQ